MAEHATTGDAINHAVDKASDALAQIAHAVSAAAPQAWGLAVRGVFAQGLATLVIGGILLFFGIAAGAIAILLGRKAHWDDDALSYASALTGIAAAVIMFFAVSNLTDGNAWVKIISPDGYLAQQILSKAL